MFRVLDQLLEQGASDRPNEDGKVVRTEGDRALFVVFDGVTEIQGSVADLMLNGQKAVSGGAWAVGHLVKFLEELDLERVADARDVLVQADQHLQTLLAPYYDATVHRWMLPAAAACCIFVDKTRDHLSVAQAADCMAAVEFKDGSPRFITNDPLAEIESYAIATMMACNREFFHPDVQRILRANRAKRNGSVYAVLDGALNINLVATRTFRLSEVRRFALFSDGLYYVRAAQEQDPFGTDLEAVTTAIFEGGLSAWHQQVHRWELHDDRNCQRTPRFKQSDDKVGLVAEVTESE